MITSQSPYLRFEDVTPPGRKTKNIEVWSVRGGDLLGRVKWFGRWRQYAFFPGTGTIWNPECLNAVNRLVLALMEERRPRRVLVEPFVDYGKVAGLTTPS